MSNLSLNAISKTYLNGFQAIHSLDLEIAPGELVVLVGPSGCGKSTLLRMIAGLESISGGDLKLGDRIVNDLEPAQRDIAMVFQNYALYPHMTVYDNLAYGLRNRKTPKTEIDRLVRVAADMLQLSHLLDRKPRQLSGGQRQRVAMGRAIVRHPRVFLFDEPLSNLDAKLRGQMRVEIKRLQRRLQTTTVYVTHDQTEAMTLADRLVVMNAGVAEQIGTPLEVYRRPQTPFVAEFIGGTPMNLWRGSLQGARLDAGFARVQLSRDYGFSGDVFVGIRPEHLHRSAAYGQRLELQLTFAEPLGADTLIYGKAEGLGAELVARLSGEYTGASEQPLNLGFDLSDLHIFCAATQQRIN